ncbi:MAG: bile acid:sodium symporter family protein [Legionellales bacterium]|nr:bile acid:sodium symporter family protein [Legionellales bacterium]
MHAKIERYFLGIVVIAVISGLLRPDLFVAWKPFISVGLGLVMFGIGMTIPTRYLTQTLLKPKRILGLVILRYALMPAAALLISKICHLTTFETMGLLVLGAAPGGISANVMAYLAGANTALTVLLTLGSTLLAPFVMPMLIYLLLHQHITIDVWSMVLHIGSIILLPILAGFLCNRYQTPVMVKIKQWTPSLSILLVAMLIACVSAVNQKALLNFPMMALLAVLMLNLVGYLMGALIAYGMGWKTDSIWATVFDYGMFDGAVAMVVCTVFIGPEAAIPAVLLGVLQNITAPLLIYGLQSKRLGLSH